MMSKSAKRIIPAGHIQIKENVLKMDNLAGVSESKALWAKDLHLPREAEYTFFAACGYQHMNYLQGMMKALKRAGKIGLGTERVVGITKAFKKAGMDLTDFAAKVTAAKEDPYTPVLLSSISILRKLGVDVGYMHAAEPCCGSPMYYAGFEKDFARHARKNYEIFKSYGVKKLIGLVPACTSALRNLYPRYIKSMDLPVQHVLEVVAQRLKETDINPMVRQKVTVTYHDPCQLSRYLEIIDEPREIIKRIEGIEFVEMDPEQCGKWSTCCGGGGLEATHPELAERVGIRRMEELLATGASVVLSNCPACEMQLTQTAKKMGASMKVVDLVKFLDEALTPSFEAAAG
jgi:Fe-S oxidoreductase